MHMPLSPRDIRQNRKHSWSKIKHPRNSQYRPKNPQQKKSGEQNSPIWNVHLSLSQRRDNAIYWQINNSRLANILVIAPVSIYSKIMMQRHSINRSRETEELRLTSSGYWQEQHSARHQYTVGPAHRSLPPNWEVVPMRDTSRGNILTRIVRLRWRLLGW